ncbi:MAG: LysM peptidoglycan-binding domain-containing protein [Nocardioides sp.]|uniref:LysM peptidoglycan-binding domain-containing protein n=1 Tax=Nocardioides sp. TaxID=35761 RepID=UPI0039E52891
MSAIAITPQPRTIQTRPTQVHPSHARPTRPSARPVARGQVRLTRRGRLVVFAGSLLLILGLAFGFGARSAATDEPERTRVITVGDGDTLWQIAGDIAPAGQVRDMVAHIQELNDMDTGGLQAGQKLVVPAAG